MAWAERGYARGMGLTNSVAVRGAPDLRALLDDLERAGLPSALLMIDNQLVAPGAPPPAAWHDVRLTTPAGTIALKLDGGRVRLTVFGNADGALLAARDRIALLLSA
jgi:hypothetical protein